MFRPSVADQYASLALPDLRHVLKRESDEWMRRRGAVVETVAGVTDHSVLVTLCADCHARLHRSRRPPPLAAGAVGRPLD